jgi:hypothetical protein
LQPITTRILQPNFLLNLSNSLWNFLCDNNWKSAQTESSYDFILARGGQVVINFCSRTKSKTSSFSKSLLSPSSSDSKTQVETPSEKDPTLSGTIPSHSASNSFYTQSLSEKVNPLQVGLSQNDVFVSEGIANGITALASFITDTSAASNIMSQSLAALKLMGCPERTSYQTGHQRWSDVDPGFSWTLVPTQSIGENPGKFYRAGSVSFLSLLGVLILVGLFAKSNENTPVAMPVDDDEQKNQQFSSSPRGGRLLQFVFRFLFPFLGTWFSTIGLLLTTTNPLDITLLSILPALILISVGILATQKLLKAIRFSATTARIAQTSSDYTKHKSSSSSSKSETEKIKIIPYFLANSFVVPAKITADEQKQQPVLVSNLRAKCINILKSDFGRKVLIGYYVWIQHPASFNVEQEKTNKSKNKRVKNNNNDSPQIDDILNSLEEQNSKRETSKSSPFFGPSTSLLHMMPRLFVRLYGPLHRQKEKKSLLNKMNNLEVSFNEHQQIRMRRMQKQQNEDDDDDSDDNDSDFEDALDDLLSHHHQKKSSTEQQQNFVLKYFQKIDFNTFQAKLSPFYNLICALSTIICSLLQGISFGLDNERHFCRTAIFINVFASFFIFLLTVRLKPLIIPFSNVVFSVMTLCSFIVSLAVCIFTETGGDWTPENSKSIEGIQLFATISGSICAAISLMTTGTRILLMSVFGKVALVSSEEYWRRLTAIKSKLVEDRKKWREEKKKREKEIKKQKQQQKQEQKPKMKKKKKKGPPIEDPVLLFASSIVSSRFPGSEKSLKSISSQQEMKELKQQQPKVQLTKENLERVGLIMTYNDI